MHRSFLFRLATIIALVMTVWISCSKNRNDITGEVDDDDSLDATPPATIVDLRATRIGTNDAEICWTAPGDDGDSGTAQQYDMRFSLDSITPANFDSTPVMANVGFPFSAGGTQCHQILELTGEQTYWVAVKTRDEVNNWSAMSNCLRFTCLTDSIVNFPDSALESAVRTAIGRPGDPIRRSHLTSLTQLFAPGKGIADLTGLEFCPVLARLTLPENQIVNLAPLSSLQSLRTIDLNSCRVIDLTPLNGLTNLEQLHINNNPITNLGPVSDLTKLTHLSINAVPATDFAPLSGLTSLQDLRAGGTSLSNLSVLSNLVGLKSLLLYGCGISDISPLAELDSLEAVWLPANQIVDITVLASWTRLAVLDLSYNRIVDIQPLVDNNGLQTGDAVSLTGNPLSETSITVHIPALQARGVNVTW